MEENGIYKVTIKTNDGREIDTYITKNGKMFFSQGMDIEETKKQSRQAKEKAEKEKEMQLKEMPKNDRPEVELFAMSHCPYGAQIEKGLLPVLDTLGDKINFKLKFCDYAMHGKREVDEELRQYCIQKEEPDKLTDYLKCFLKEGKSDNCLKETGINSAKLSNCVNSADKKYGVTEKYNDKSSWINGKFPAFDIYKEDNAKYGIQGSPNLIVNGKKISTERDSASLLKTICSGFTNPPEECKKQLSSTSPSPGFGFKEGNGNTNASCN